MAAELLRRLARLRAELPPPVDVRAHARDVVVIASSSRGGSSIFAEVLRRSHQLLHFRAEVNPFFRLHGLEDAAGHSSDAIPADAPLPDGLGQTLGWDCGLPTQELQGPEAIRRLAIEWACRLALQWPDLEVDLEDVDLGVHEALRALQAEGWPTGVFVDPQPFAARLLAHLRRRCPELHPGAYDLDRELIARFHPGPFPTFVPRSVVEEPPFVLVSPWRPATELALATQPLVIKTPGNVYRLPWLRRLFPQMRILHLVRNAAASINGLYDGWRYPGFHAWPTQLSIPGYTGEVPGGDRWWKFDRPPGWENQRDRPLGEVCAFQWASAHAAVLADNRVGHRLRFEDVLGPASRQAPALAGLARWLGVPVYEELAAVLAGTLPLVMATHQPRHRRWFARIGMLAPLLAEPPLRELMGALGYGDDPNDWE